MASEQKVAAMRKVGREWEKAGKHRIYFNIDVPTLFGLQYTTYNTGNISSARLFDDHISNSECRRLLARWGEGKVWYDFADDRYHMSGFDLDSDEKKAVFAKVKALVAAAEKSESE